MAGSELWFCRDRWVMAVVCSDWGYSGLLRTEQNKTKKKTQNTLDLKVEHAHRQPDGFEKMIGMSVRCRFIFIHKEHFTV